MRVALFATCLGDRFFADACVDAVRLLRWAGAEVHVPSGQTCCGQPAYNSGHAREAKRLAAHTLDVLADTDYVVLPSGSCAGMLRSLYPDVVEPALRDRAHQLAERTFELAQFLVDVAGVERVGDGLSGRRVAYHHGCHALRELRSREQPLRLLEGAGATLVPWEAAEECCGFGGLFSVKMPEVSAGMADRKLDTLADADVVTSADPGCLMQLSGRASVRGEAVPFRHLASVLWEGVGA